MTPLRILNNVAVAAKYIGISRRQLLRYLDEMAALKLITVRHGFSCNTKGIMLSVEQIESVKTFIAMRRASPDFNKKKPGYAAKGGVNRAKYA